MLHLATHGYYLETGSIDGQPLLQSGITLAGANRALAGEVGPDGENGVLHAVEAQTLNLYGTELVVLSACDTGKGAVDYSEGLEGLPRALYVAGARNVLVALWPVGDRAARNFMERFYETWLAQPISDPALALRQTKLAYIASRTPPNATPPPGRPSSSSRGEAQRLEQVRLPRQTNAGRADQQPGAPAMIAPLASNTTLSRQEVGEARTRRRPPRFARRRRLPPASAVRTRRTAKLKARVRHRGMGVAGL